MKNYLKLLLLSVVIFSFIVSPVAYAEENTVYISNLTYDEFGNILTPIEEEIEVYDDSPSIEPKYNPMQTFYEQRNKKSLGSIRKLTEYLTQDWAYSDKYNFTTSKTFTSSWTINGSAEVKKAISAGGGYTRSVSKSYSVSTSIPANDKKQSKLVRETEYNKYTVDIYKYRSNGMHSTPKEYIGTGAIDSPSSTYLVVKYK